jgi:hypothetical protein
MARGKSNSSFVVTSHVPEDDALHGIGFKSHSQAQKFADGMAKFANKLAAKIKFGDNKDASKDYKGTLPFDILIQPLNESNQPVGEPSLFDTVGLGE